MGKGEGVKKKGWGYFVGAGEEGKGGGDACVALEGGENALEQDEGDASVPSPRPHHSRPYEITAFLPR